MKVRFDREKLRSCWQRATLAVDLGGNLKLLVTDTSATLMARGDRGLEVWVDVALDDVEVDAPGQMLLPVDLVGPILAHHELGRRVTVEKSDTTRGIVRGERSEFGFSSKDPSTFDDVLPFSAKAYHEINPHGMDELLRRTVHAVAEDEGHYVFTGVRIEASGDRIVAVGVDGSRMAVQSAPAKYVGGSEPDGAGVIPTNAVKWIQAGLSWPLGDVAMRLVVGTEGVTVWREQEWTMRSPYVEGRYPTWQDVIPPKAEMTRIDIPIGQIKHTLDLARKATDARDGRDGRDVLCEFSESELVLSCSIEDVASRVVVPIDHAGERVAARVNARFLAEWLGAIRHGDRDIAFYIPRDKTRAILLEANGDYQGVIVPMRGK